MVSMATNWHRQVIQQLLETNDKLFRQAIKACEEESESKAPLFTDPKKFLEWMRGDEPADCRESGDTAKAYATFLLEEWKLFGPQGE
jgi:hypothetical protein